MQSFIEDPAFSSSEFLLTITTLCILKNEEKFRYYGVARICMNFFFGHSLGIPEYKREVLFAELIPNVFLNVDFFS